MKSGIFITLIFVVAYKYFRQYHIKAAKAKQLTADSVKTTETAFHELNQILDDFHNPCMHLKNRMDLIFKLKKDDIQRFIERINEKGCFDNEDFFFTLIDLVIDNNREDLISSYLYYTANKRVIGNLLYKCASNRFYSCVSLIIQDDPMVSFQGQNILHFAAKFNDLNLFNMAPVNQGYLLLRDEKDKNVPTKYAQSPELIDAFLTRSEMEILKTAYPKELLAHITYMKASLYTTEIGLEHRIKRLFDYSLITDTRELIPSISISDVLHSSYHYLHVNHGDYWYSPLNTIPNVDFFDETSSLSNVNEPVKFWIKYLIDSIFCLETGLFQSISETSHHLVPTQAYDVSFFKFAGSIVAFALSQGISSRVEFIPTIYRLILGIEPVRYDDLEIIDPILYNAHSALMESFLNEDYLCLLAFINIEEIYTYIQAEASKLLYENYKESLEAFAEGFRSKIPRDISKYLDLTDLKNSIQGPIL